jgi:hypothetical protein
MGRKQVYSTKEQATEAQKKQIRAHEEKYKQQHKEYKEKVSNTQRQIVILLSKNVIEDEPYLKELLKTFRAKIGVKIEEKTEVKTEENIITEAAPTGRATAEGLEK